MEGPARDEITLESGATVRAVDNPLSDGLQPMATSPPGTFHRLLNAYPFYAAVLCGWVVLCWSLWYRTGHQAFAINAVLQTVVAVLVLFLRAVRGSVIDARLAMRQQLLDQMQSGITPSHRLAERVHQDGSYSMLEGDMREKVVWESQLHPLSIPLIAVRRLFSSRLLTTITGMYLVGLGIAWATHNIAGLIVSLAVVGYAGLVTVHWGRDRYAITEMRIIAVLGLFSTRVPVMPRAQITDVIVTTSPLANILAWLRFIKLPYGEFDLESAGQDQGLKKIPYLPGADVVAATLGLSRLPNQGA